MKLAVSDSARYDVFGGRLGAASDGTAPPPRRNSGVSLSQDQDVRDAPEFPHRWCRRSAWKASWCWATENVRRINVAPCHTRNCADCRPVLAAQSADVARATWSQILREHPDLRLYRMVLDTPQERQREMDAIYRAGHYAWVVPQDGGASVVYTTYRSRRVQRAGYVETWGEDGDRYSEEGVDLRWRLAEDYEAWSGNHEGEDQRRGAFNGRARAVAEGLGELDRTGRPATAKAQEKAERLRAEGVVVSGAQVERVARFEVGHDRDGKPYQWRLPDTTDPWPDVAAYAEVFAQVVPANYLAEIGHRWDASHRPPVVFAA